MAVSCLICWGLCWSLALFCPKQAFSPKICRPVTFFCQFQTIHRKYFNGFHYWSILFLWLLSYLGDLMGYLRWWIFSRYLGFLLLLVWLLCCPAHLGIILSLPFSHKATTDEALVHPISHLSSWKLITNNILEMSLVGNPCNSCNAVLLQ